MCKVEGLGLAPWNVLGGGMFKTDEELAKMKENGMKRGERRRREKGMEDGEEEEREGDGGRREMYREFLGSFHF